MVKAGKKVLSVQLDIDIYDKLKDICEAEDRSQAKQITAFVKEKHKALKLDKK